MAEPRDSFRALLEADSTFADPLTGGIYDASELPEEGLTPTEAPGAWDAYGVLKPCAVIRWRGSVPVDAYPENGSERRTVEVYVYQQDGIDTVDAAISRLAVLLNRYRLIASGKSYHFKRAGTMGEFVADEVGGANAMMARFQVSLFVNS